MEPAKHSARLSDINRIGFLSEKFAQLRKSARHPAVFLKSPHDTALRNTPPLRRRDKPISLP